ncbi:MAG TPA: RHS repeat-associated core domain-containing protein [Phycisphaerae bacterium]|nr:RHS repeat-associated core domain-containing protein [Phycisphaerae bacterium]
MDWQTGGEAGYEYALTNETYTWADARAYAESRGGDLAQCLLGGECEWIYATFNPEIEDQHWLGAAQESGSNGIEPDEGWYWTISGYPIYPEDPWLPGAPNDGDPGENCTTSGGSSHTACRDYDVAALVYNYDAGTAGVIGGFDDIDEETELQAIIQREVGDVCSDGVLDYTRTYAWEFRYDGPRQRYLRREVDPYTFDMLSEEWSDYSGDWVYADFVLDAQVPGGAHSVRDYLAGEAHADSSTHGVWDGEAYYHGNQIDSTRLMTDATPHVVRSYVYDAFGNVYDTSGSATTRYRYAGASGYQSHDDFPFLHVGARYYDPETGRFLQRDPIGIRGGVNVYEYVRSNPVRQLDPLGLGSEDLGSGRGIFGGCDHCLISFRYYKWDGTVRDGGWGLLAQAWDDLFGTRYPDKPHWLDHADVPKFWRGVCGWFVDVLVIIGNMISPVPSPGVPVMVGPGDGLII